MKKFISSIATLALLFACTPEEKTTVVELTGITLSEHDITFEVGDNKVLVVTFTPKNATNKDVTWMSSAPYVATVIDGVVEGVAPGTTVVVAKSGNLTDKCKVTVKNPVPDGAVDLGLSVYWATCNVGANFPEEYGDYYAWGETETKEDYSWETYKWCNGSYYTLTKYNNSSSYGTVDNKTVLDLEDDVAHVKLGGNWRMPTSSEVDELTSTTYNSSYRWKWESHNGHNGWLVTYLVNNHSIFLPAAGYRKDADLRNADSNGYYWSSSLYTGQFLAWDLHFFSAFQGGTQYTNRSYGHSVRPVTE